MMMYWGDTRTIMESLANAYYRRIGREARREYSDTNPFLVVLTDKEKKKEEQAYEYANKIANS
mgnify:CR=1 FL=1